MAIMKKNEALQNAQLSCERSTRMRCQLRLEACSLRRLHSIPGGGGDHGGDRFGDWIQTEGGIAGRCAVNKGLLLPGHAKALFVHQEKIDHSQLFTLVSVFIMDLGMAIAAAIV